MSYIVKAGPGCSGESCRICEDYLSGFFSRNGGIIVVIEKDRAELAAQFCPQQVIDITKFIDNRGKS